MARKEREKQTSMDKKANGKALGDESAEAQSPKSKVIRVESEETQDYVRYEPGASRRNKFRAKRDQHSTSFDNALRFWQSRLSMMMLRSQHIQSSVSTKGCWSCQWKAVVEKKARRGRLWRMLGRDQFIQGM